jgi:hypothetical protein
MVGLSLTGILLHVLETHALSVYDYLPALTEAPREEDALHLGAGPLVSGQEGVSDLGGHVVVQSGMRGAVASALQGFRRGGVRVWQITSGAPAATRAALPPQRANVGYALQQETQVHPALRSVKGAIIVDVPFKTNNEAFRQTACQLAAQKQAEIIAGV